MKKLFAVLLFLTAVAVADGDKDMKQLQDYGNVGSGSSSLYFSRWHDGQSGVEFICAQNSRWNNDSSVSCFPTGRKW